MNLKNRLQKLESHKPSPPQLRDYPPGHYERSMQTLADALTDITGQAITAAEIMEGLVNEPKK